MADTNSIDFEYDYLYKIILIGDSSVGKSSLLTRYARPELSIDNMSTTIGVEFATKTIKILDKNIKLQIWDTAGQERYRAITSAYYRGAAGAIIVYDVNKMETFKNIRRWIAELKDYANNDIIITLIGNKSDLTNDREVSLEEGKKLAKDYQVSFLETSAKEYINIEQCFFSVAQEIYKRITLPKEKSELAYQKYEELHSEPIRISDYSFKTKKKCC